MSSIAEKHDVAPSQAAGQRSRSILVGLVGKGIQLSRTPAMHEADGRARGWSFVYKLLDTERMGGEPPALGELVAWASRLGFVGINVTYPYKQEILAHLDDLTDEAQVAGSVNTVVLRNNRRIGHNTDIWGFRESFREQLSDARCREVLLIGAGGAGGAVAIAALCSGADRLVVHDADPARARSLVSRLSERFGAGRVAMATERAEAARTVDGIINTTPVGMETVPGMPIAPALLDSRMWVADIVYFPLETELLRSARRAGCRTMSGEGMAINQAARAFKLFTGAEADRGRMREAFAAWTAPN